MNKFSFIYLVFVYLLGSIYTLQSNITIEHQIIGSFLLIALIGIPHGAIDNIILQSEYKITKFKFYSLYLLSIFLYSLIWIILPFYAFVLFLIISAYHFGESQLVNHLTKIKLKKLIFLLWGISLISTLFYYNQLELRNLFYSNSDTKNLIYIFNYNIIKYIFFSSNSILIGFLVYLSVYRNFSKNEINQELFQIFLIHITFYLFPIIISFTLYFVFLHSLKALTQEFKYLNQKVEKTSTIKFIKILFPHSFISLLFVSFLIILSQKNFIVVSELLLLIISISVITLPHAIVMTKFYENN
jgi:Brp/Blh family beta-carotene 15,15'-monooxygenase